MAFFSLFWGMTTNPEQIFVFLLSNGFGPSKIIDFTNDLALFFHVFSKPIPRIVFRGSQCQTFIKVGLGCHFGSLWFSKRHPLGYPFAQVDEQKKNLPNGPGRPSTDHIFHETIVITVPFGPSLLFFVLCFIYYFYDNGC